MSIHWIVDQALKREGGYDFLIHSLERTQTPYTLVRKPPFADYLVGPEDNDTPITVEVPNPVYATGTTSLGLVSKTHGWNPGYVEGIDQLELVDNWGDEVLNRDAIIGPIADIEPIWGEFFARPVHDTKAFSGAVFKRGDWDDFVKNIVGIQNSHTTIRSDDLVMLAPLKRIYAEYRLYVVGGDIVTGSLYKLGQKVFYNNTLDAKMLDYARARIKEFCPRRAMCLDIAQIEADGDTVTYKVIECNAISSAGFYACDMLAFVGAINSEFASETCLSGERSFRA
jgi:hypothetical protein